MAPPHVFGLRMVDMYCCGGRLRTIQQERQTKGLRGTHPRIPSLYVIGSFVISSATTKSTHVINRVESGSIGVETHFFASPALDRCSEQKSMQQKKTDMNYHLALPDRR
jgi:hypothetical protein